MDNTFSFVLVGFLVLLLLLGVPPSCEGQLNIEKTLFGNVDGTDVYIFTLSNSNGIRTNITQYGGTITSLFTPDRNHTFADIVLGFDTLDRYLEGRKDVNRNPYFGALIGRYANRIARGRFTLDETDYQVSINEPPNHLHGGFRGFDKQIWTVVDGEEEEEEEDDDDVSLLADGVSLSLNYVSQDGEEGYPGILNVTVTYTLTDKDEFIIDYKAKLGKKKANEAETEDEEANGKKNKTTVLNLTNHSYFNLAAGLAKDCLDHLVYLNAAFYTVVDNQSIPTGEQRAVNGTSFDFYSKSKSIGERIANAGGYDHNFVLNNATNTTDDKKIFRFGKKDLVLTATIIEPITSRKFDVFTSQPGVQFYSGNKLDGGIVGKYGITYAKHYGFVLETQHFPDSPNQPSFPSTVLNAGDKYRHTTVWKFGVKK